MEDLEKLHNVLSNSVGLGSIFESTQTCIIWTFKRVIASYSVLKERRKILIYRT